MTHPGDMLPVAYPDDTLPAHLISLEHTEVPYMAGVELVYVDLYGNEVSATDPAAQTKYHPDELKALRKGGYFPKAPGTAAEPKAEDAPSPVMHSGVGQAADDEDDAKPAARAGHSKR